MKRPWQPRVRREGCIRRLNTVRGLGKQSVLVQKTSLRRKRFHLVSEQRKTGFGRARNETTLLAPFFARSLTLVPRSLLLNRSETLATQATKD